MKYTHDTRANKMEEGRITIQVKKRAIHDDMKYWGKTDPTFGGNRPLIPMLHPKSIVGKNISVQHSSVVGLIGQFFIVTDLAVLHAMEAGAQMDASALTSLHVVAFLVFLGTDFIRQVYTSPQDWAAIYDGGYTGYLTYLRSDASHKAVTTCT